jgi:hypothetical protein
MHDLTADGQLRFPVSKASSCFRRLFPGSGRASVAYGEQSSGFRNHFPLLIRNRHDRAAATPGNENTALRQPCSFNDLQRFFEEYLFTRNLCEARTPVHFRRHISGSCAVDEDVSAMGISGLSNSGPRRSARPERLPQSEAVCSPRSLIPGFGRTNWAKLVSENASYL